MDFWWQRCWLLAEEDVAEAQGWNDDVPPVFASVPWLLGTGGLLKV